MRGTEWSMWRHISQLRIGPGGLYQTRELGAAMQKSRIPTSTSEQGDNEKSCGCGTSSLAHTSCGSGLGVEAYDICRGIQLVEAFSLSEWQFEQTASCIVMELQVWLGRIS
eukprot:4801697-Amphidinium_carterae.1